MKDNLNINLPLNGWDNSMTQYRSDMFEKMIKYVRKLFVNRYSFTGDDDFTKSKQRLFLRFLFNTGAACIHNPRKSIYDYLNNGLENFISYNDFSPIVKDVTDDKKVLMTSGWLIDENNRIYQGIGVVSGRTTSPTQRSFVVTKNDSAFCKYNDDWESGLSLWSILVYTWVDVLIALKTKLGLVNPLIGVNNVNNSSARLYDNIYSTLVNTIQLTPAQTSVTATDKLKIKVSNLISQELVKVNFSGNEKITDLIPVLDAIKEEVFKLGAQRVKSAVSKGDSVTDEFTDDEIIMRILEDGARDQFEMFIDEYEKIYGIKLELVDAVDTHISDIEEKQMAMSGRALGVANEGENDKDN